MSSYTAADIRGIGRMQKYFMNFVGYCLNISHQKHDYRPISQAFKLNYFSVRLFFCLNVLSLFCNLAYIFVLFFFRKYLVNNL